MHRQELLQAFVLANAFKEGDLCVGGTRDEKLRAEARQVVASLPLKTIAENLPVAEDGVSEALARSAKLPPAVADLTLGRLKQILLGPEGARWAQRYSERLSSEMIAGIVKLMTNAELAALARTLFNPLPATAADETLIPIGSPRHFGSRIQPNSPGDDEEEILFSILEGLSYGCGDVILGLNPASDDLDTIIRLEQLLARVVERLELPTRFCVLSDIVKQSEARLRTRVDVGFQSLAGTSKALYGMVGLDIEGITELARGFSGLYFETGQGSEVTNGTAEGIDMVTLEARTYGVTRHIRRTLAARDGEAPVWMIVNDVAGFIGPEVFRSGEQLLRACLEDTVMAKLHGLTMGLDVCATFHMGIEPRALHILTETIVEQAAPAYLMAVAGNADPMLGYLTTSFREHPKLRAKTGRRITTAMQKRLTALGALSATGEPQADPPNRQAALYAVYAKAGGDSRSHASLCREALRKLGKLAEIRYDLGYGSGTDHAAPPVVAARLEGIYRHARRALYAELDERVLDAVSPKHLQVRTQAQDRDGYIAHPACGERICDQDAARIATLYPTRRPAVQIAISDGLNANALNENLRALIPPLRHALLELGRNVGEVDIVIKNGRVRAGYHIGTLLEVEIMIHLIGERPGTGLDTVSAYLTYGRDPEGHSRWCPELDHACTTAVCGIHRRGKPPAVAAQEIVRKVKRMFEERCSGVALGARLDERGR
jgi:ethanolamine ammonia-lyase large subunit